MFLVLPVMGLTDHHATRVGVGWSATGTRCIFVWSRAFFGRLLDVGHGQNGTVQDGQYNCTWAPGQRVARQEVAA